MQLQHQNGQMKHNLRLTVFLLRGKKKIKTEISTAKICFNIAQIITIFKRSTLINLKAAKPIEIFKKKCLSKTNILKKSEH